MHVNTVDPRGVKIVAGFILSQQSQPQLGQKQYLDMAADVPKQAREDRPARGTRGMAGLWGSAEYHQPRESAAMISFFFYHFFFTLNAVISLKFLSQ